MADILGAIRDHGSPMSFKDLVAALGCGFQCLSYLHDRNNSVFVVREVKDGNKSRTHGEYFVYPHPHLTAHWPNWKGTP